MRSSLLRTDNYLKFIIIFIISNIAVAILILIFESSFGINEDSNEFLPSGLQAAAGIVGIVFAISMIVVQHAATNYSPTILSSFKRDGKVWFSLAYGLFTIVFMSLTMIFAWHLIILNLFLFVSTLGLLAMYFLYTFEKINPLSIIVDIKRSLVSEFSTITSKIENIEIVQRQNDPTGLYQMLITNTPYVVYHTILSTRPHLLDNVKKYESTLRQIIYDAVKRGEYQTSKEGLDVYPVLIEKYVKIIPDNQWINDKFLEETLELINGFSSNAIKNGDIVFLKDLVESFKNTAAVLATSIPKIGSVFEQNQPFSLCVFYLSQIGQKALGVQLFDVTATAIRALGDIGVYSAVKYHHDHLVFKDVMTLAYLAIGLKDFFIPSVAIQRLFMIIQALIVGLTRPEHITPRIEELQTLFETFLKSRLSDLQIMGFFTEIANYGVIPCVKTALSIKNADYDPFETRGREELEKEIVDSLIGMVAAIGRTAVQNNRVPFALSCSDCLFHIATLCVKEKFKTFPTHHKDELRKIIYGLGSLHNYNPEVHSTFGTDISSKVTEAVLLCASNGFVDLAEIAVDRIYNLSISVLNNDEHGYEAIRTLHELDPLACYGISISNQSLSNRVAQKYVEFDKAYEAKFGKEPTDPATEINRFSFDDYDEFRVNYQPLRELLKNIMNADNGLKFQKLIIELKLAELKAKLKALKKKKR